MHYKLLYLCGFLQILISEESVYSFKLVTESNLGIYAQYETLLKWTKSLSEDKLCTLNVCPYELYILKF